MNAHMLCMATLSAPKDWPDTWKDLQTIDSLLRCSICCQFFKDTTCMTSCSHNYCSLCIRGYLVVDSKCPVCGINSQDTQLENNRIIDEMVKCFVNIRGDLLKVVKNSISDDDSDDKKRKESVKKNITSKDKATSSNLSRTSQKRHRKASNPMASDNSFNEDTSSPVVIKKRKQSLPTVVHLTTSDSDEISIIQNPTLPKSPKTSRSQVKYENLVDCPVCSMKIPAAKINFHLDTCLSSEDGKENLRSPQVARRKPLKKLDYTLLLNSDLKRRMKKHGLSIKGNRQTLIKRLQKFTIMYSSECSKPRPRTVADIVRSLEEGERKKNKRERETRNKLNFKRGRRQEDIDKMKDEYKVSKNEEEFTRLKNKVRSRKKEVGQFSDDNSATSFSSGSKEETTSTSFEFNVKRRRTRSRKTAIAKSDEHKESSSSECLLRPACKIRPFPTVNKTAGSLVTRCNKAVVKPRIRCVHSACSQLS